MNNLVPIVLFVYNRPWHTCQTVEALRKNDLARESDLIIYSDGPKNEMAVKDVQEVRDYIKTIKGFKNVKIIERDKNFGLATSIISGVTEIINKFGKVIVLEDDLVTSPHFLKYMNKALEFYENDMRIFSVTGVNYLKNIPATYNYDVYLSYRGSSWGWGTWEDRWVKVDWAVTDFSNFIKDNKAQKQFNRGGDDLTDMLSATMNNKVDSWSIIWCYNQYKNNAFCLYPKYNMINNIGIDNSGVNSGGKDIYKTEISNNSGKIKFTNDLDVSEEIARIMRSFFKRKLKNIIKRFVKIIS